MPVPMERVVYRDVPYPVEQIVEKIVERDVPVPTARHVMVPTPVHVTQPVEKVLQPARPGGGAEN